MTAMTGVRPTSDAVVVGGGPAGLVTALELAAREIGVTVLERAAAPPVDKPCGEGLMPDAVERLETLGVALPPGTGRRFGGIRYLDASGVVAEGRFPGPGGLGVRRTALHAALVRRAQAAGVEIRWGVRASDVEPETGRVETTAGRLLARWVVAADGLRSPLRRVAGLERPGRRRRSRTGGRFGVRRHLAVAPWSDAVEVHWADGAEAYVTPVGERLVGVAILWTPEGGAGRPGFARLLERFPALLERLGGAPGDPEAAWTSPLAGCGPLEQRVCRVRRDRLALVGDAAGYVDALTGEGLAVAFHQAMALAEAIAAGDLALYERAVPKIRRLPDTMTRLLLAVERRPWLRRRAIRTLAAEPAVFDRLLAIHARRAPPSSLRLSGLFRLAHGLLTA